ncbi:hypothetical protein FOMPIDRAFT_1057245 [Fomitopsis schrenkii]|uniref:Uncharacterized protein n=1 Tax=Fomitopsis schrenkii TaxID=2126942 RepID=S8EMU8_FOMSC|nr:hypothetical protein FOMPIDRAFT_1057245 [Fomitopsis schrenkii]
MFAHFHGGFAGQAPASGLANASHAARPAAVIPHISIPKSKPASRETEGSRMGLGHEGIEHCTALSTSTVLYVCGSLYARHCPQRYEGLVIPLEIGREAGRGARDGMSLDWISGHCRLHLRARQRGSDELPVAQRKPDLSSKHARCASKIMMPALHPFYHRPRGRAFCGVDDPPRKGPSPWKVTHRAG